MNGNAVWYIPAILSIWAACSALLTVGAGKPGGGTLKFARPAAVAAKFEPVSWRTNGDFKSPGKKNVIFMVYTQNLYTSTYQKYPDQ